MAVFRARLQQGPQGDRTISNSQALAAVRTRLHEARALAKRRRQADGTDTPAARRATRKLVREHRDEFTRLVGAQLRVAGVAADISEDIPAGGTAIARWALGARHQRAGGPCAATAGPDRR